MRATPATEQDRRTRNREPLFDGRRRFPRARVRAEVFLERDDDVLAAEAVDLGLRGVLLRTLRPDPVGSRGVVRIALEGQTRMIRAEVEVVRAGPRSMALAFRSMDDGDRSQLAAHLIRTLGLRALPQLDRRFADVVRRDG